MSTRTLKEIKIANDYRYSNHLNYGDTVWAKYSTCFIYYEPLETKRIHRLAVLLAKYLELISTHWFKLIRVFSGSWTHSLEINPAFG
jgi:hypothetical protein